MKNLASSLALLLITVVVATAVPVTFQVDMSVQIENGSFNPATDTVQARGAFQNPVQWTGGFTLTNSPANTSIYTGTYDDLNAPGTFEQYKFVFVKFGEEPNIWDHAEGIDNRSFTLQNGAQTLPLVYFGNLSPVSGVAEHPVTFQVDMSVQTQKGNFNPLTDLVLVRGSFQAPTQWAASVFLTNSIANTNLYSVMYPDRNYPGSQQGYKFFIAHGGNLADPTGWEVGNNRQYTLGPNGLTLPLTLFDNEIGTPIPVTFQVDMSGQTAQGKFNPATDTVEIRGTYRLGDVNFQWLTNGIVLTNAPGGNTNVFVATYPVPFAPSTLVEYKFVFTNPSTGVNWEEIYTPPIYPYPANRTFVLQSGSQVLPVVQFGESPIIASLSGSRAAVVGNNVTLNVTASGSNPKHYIWRLNSVPIVAQTNGALTVTNLQLSGFGDYSVLVTNDAGMVLSGNMTITLATNAIIQSPRKNLSTFLFDFTTELGPTYVVQYKDTLADPAWLDLNSYAGSGLPLPFTDNANALTNRMRFYRISVR